MKLFRILLVAPGESVHAQRFAKWILENGGEVYFLDASNPFPEGYPNFHFISYPYRGDRKLRRWFGSKWGGKLSAWLNVPLLWSIWRKIKPDLVHVHYVDHRAYQSLLAGHRPLVLSVWGSDINYQFLPDADPELSKMVGLSLLKANRVLADAPDMISRCQKLAGSEINVDLLTFGIDTQAFHAGYLNEVKVLKSRLAISEEAFVFLSIRGWNRYYNHDLILEAFCKAYPSFRRPAYLVFKRYGAHVEAAALQNQIVERAKELGIDRAVFMLDEIPNSQMPELYNFADTIVNYPSVDAFPVSFFEAAACERSVLTCRLPAYEGEFVEKYFRCVPPEDVEALCQAMVSEVNEEANSELRLAARQWVVDHDDQSISIRKLLAIYSQIIAKNPMWREKV